MSSFLAGRAVEAQGARCGLSNWSPITPLVTAHAQPIYVERPRATQVRGGIALIGSPTFVWATPDVLRDGSSIQLTNEKGMSAFAGALLGAYGQGKPIPLPAGVRRMMAPQVIGSPNNSVDVYWATTRDSVADNPIGGNEIWMAKFDGAKWSVAVRVATADMIYWTDEGASIAASVTGEAIAVRAHTSGADAKAGVLYAQHAPDGWHSSWIPTGTLPPRDVALASGHDGLRVIAFGGSMNTDDKMEHNGIYVVRSSNAGSAWGHPLLVREDVADTVASVPILFAYPNGEIHLLWLDRVRHGPRGFLVRHRVSADDGETWGELPTLSMPAGTDILRATALPHGELLVVGRDPRTRIIQMALWRPSGWTSVVAPFQAAALSTPTLSIGGMDTLYLTWGIGRTGGLPYAPQVPAPVLVFSKNTASCLANTRENRDRKP